MSAYTDRVTIFVPAADVDDANQLALVLGESAADDQTFGDLNGKDGEDNTYAVASTLATATFSVKAGSPLQAPAHAPDVDLEAAGRAQAKLVIYDPENPVQAAPGRILAVKQNANDEPREALEWAGVSRVEAEAI